MAKNTFPVWVLKHRTKGTAIHLIRGKYYLYKISSKWDSKKGRAVKKTDKYLGRITNDELLPPKARSMTPGLEKVTIKEFGATVLMNHLTQDIQDQIKKIYPENWKSIFTSAVIRFFHNSPMKNMDHHYRHSYLSELFAGAVLNPKAVSDMMQKLDSDREKMVLFMRGLAGQTSENLIIDMTHIFSESENINWLSMGHNSQDQFHNQLNMLLIFSNDRKKPVYFRLLPGDIRDVSAFKSSISESGLSNALFVGDKGFHSLVNVEMLEKENLQYILPIKRNNGDVDYDVMKKQSRRNFDGYFLFDDRHIWHKELKTDGNRRFVLFFDERLKTEEECSFLQRANRLPEDKKDEKEQILNTFYEKEFELGTITIVTNTKHSAEDIYKYLKARINVEVTFDTFKNILEADKTYMRTDAQMYGWLFINFVSLLLYYSLYGILISKELLSKYSPKDVVLHFSKVYKVKILDREIISEIPKITRVLAQKMEIPDDLLHKT